MLIYNARFKITHLASFIFIPCKNLDLDRHIFDKNTHITLSRIELQHYLIKAFIPQYFSYLLLPKVKNYAMSKSQTLFYGISYLSFYHYLHFS